MIRPPPGIVLYVNLSCKNVLVGLQGVLLIQHSLSNQAILFSGIPIPDHLIQGTSSTHRLADDLDSSSFAVWFDEEVPSYASPPLPELRHQGIYLPTFQLLGISTAPPPLMKYICMPFAAIRLIINCCQYGAYILSFAVTLLWYSS